MVTLVAFDWMVRKRNIMDQEKIGKLKQIIAASKQLVFFGGAGVSTESGIPDFRSKDGLYHQEYKYEPEFLLSKTCLDIMPEEFWKFYRNKLLLEGILPNNAHKALAKLEKEGILSAVITQNIDNLHELAGSEHVFHIHGTIMTNHCLKCNKEFALKEIIRTSGIPECECGGMIRPDVTLYEELLPQKAWNDSISALSAADTLIIAGTSLVVYPASTLIDYFNGDHLVVINRDATSQDKQADLVIRDNIGEVLRLAVHI